MLKNLINTDKYEKLFGMLLMVCSLLSVGISFGKIYLIHATIAPILIYILFNKKTSARLKSIFRNKINISFLLILFILIVSTLWAVSTKAAIIYISQYFLGISILIGVQVFIYNEKQLQYYVKTLFFPFVIFLIGFGLLESISPLRWPISAYSDYNLLFRREDLISNLREIEKIVGYSDASPSVFYWNTNNFAYLLAAFVPFIAKWNYKNLLVLLPCLVVLFYSGAKIIIILILISFLIYAFKDKMKLLFIPFIFAFMASIILIVPDSILAVKTNEIWVSMTDTNIRFPRNGMLLNEELSSDLDESSSGAIRKELFLFDVQLLKESYLLGIGAGSVGIRNKEIAHKTKGMTSTHFYWLEIVVSGGVLVGIIYIFALTSIGCHYIRKLTTQNQQILQTLFLLIAGVISLSSSHYFLPYYLVLGILISPISGKFQTQNLLDE